LGQYLRGSSQGIKTALSQTCLARGSVDCNSGKEGLRLDAGNSLRQAGGPRSSSHVALCPVTSPFALICFRVATDPEICGFRCICIPTRQALTARKRRTIRQSVSISEPLRAPKLFLISSRAASRYDNGHCSRQCGFLSTDHASLLRSARQRSPTNTWMN
jgi:hypothetical protein